SASHLNVNSSETHPNAFLPAGDEKHRYSFMIFVLKVYITDDCPTCQETKDLVAMLQEIFPNLQIDLLNLSNPNTIYPDSVFATPTFALNGRTIFLGNPSPAEMIACLQEEGIPMVE
ncbi:MAG: hypothetical protein D6796_06830, partial [Caldilineae bacterium]